LLSRAHDRRFVLREMAVTVNEDPLTYEHVLQLLEHQADGDAESRHELSRLSAEILEERSRGTEGPGVLGVILQEWEGMFSFDPGRIEGLDPLRELVRFASASADIDVLDVYRHPAWGRLVELRGPVESVLLCECDRCRTTYPQMGISGFLDVRAFLCPGCGSVEFQSSFADSAGSACGCGQTRIPGCPNCGASSNAAVVVDEINPYEYFATHSFIRTD
jgi:hypothetical protein